MSLSPVGIFKVSLAVVILARQSGITYAGNLFDGACSADMNE